MYYRLYRLSGVDDHFVAFEEIEANDDVEAVRIAAQRAGDHPHELWCRQRKVKRFAGRPADQAGA